MTTGQTILHMEDLVQETGLTARTIRYYIALGLVPKAWMLGKNAHYSLAHLDWLKRIKDLQAAGQSLEQIRESLHSRAAPPVITPADLVVSQPVNLFAREGWDEYVNIAPDVRFAVRQRVDPKRVQQIQKGIWAFLKATTEEEFPSC